MGALVGPHLVLGVGQREATGARSFELGVQEVQGRLVEKEVQAMAQEGAQCEQEVHGQVVVRGSEALLHEQVLEVEVQQEHSSAVVLDGRLGEQHGLVGDVMGVLEERERAQATPGENWRMHSLDVHGQYA